jgi:hypothetical protein
LFSIGWDGMIVCKDSDIWEEAVVAYVKALPQHSARETDDKHETLLFRTTVPRPVFLDTSRECLLIRQASRCKYCKQNMKRIRKIPQAADFSGNCQLSWNNKQLWRETLRNCPAILPAEPSSHNMQPGFVTNERNMWPDKLHKKLKHATASRPITAETAVSINDVSHPLDSLQAINIRAAAGGRTAYVSGQQTVPLQNKKSKSKAVPLHAMEALGGRGGIAPTHSRPRH